MHSFDHMRASEAYWRVGGLTDELRGVEKTMADCKVVGRITMEENEAGINGAAGKGTQPANGTGRRVAKIPVEAQGARQTAAHLNGVFGKAMSEPYTFHPSIILRMIRQPSVVFFQVSRTVCIDLFNCG